MTLSEKKAYRTWMVQQKLEIVLAGLSSCCTIQTVRRIFIEGVSCTSHKPFPFGHSRSRNPPLDPTAGMPSNASGDRPAYGTLELHHRTCITQCWIGLTLRRHRMCVSV